MACRRQRRGGGAASRDGIDPPSVSATYVDPADSGLQTSSSSRRSGRAGPAGVVRSGRPSPKAHGTPTIDGVARERRFRRCEACSPVAEPGEVCDPASPGPRPPRSTKRGSGSEPGGHAKRIRLSSTADALRERGALEFTKQAAKRSFRVCPVCGAPRRVQIFSERNSRRPVAGTARESWDRDDHRGPPRSSTPRRSGSGLCFSPPDFSFVLEHFDPLDGTDVLSFSRKTQPVRTSVDAGTGNWKVSAGDKDSGGLRYAEGRGNRSPQAGVKRPDSRRGLPRFSVGTEITHLTVEGGDVLDSISILPIPTTETSSVAGPPEPPHDKEIHDRRDCAGVVEGLPAALSDGIVGHLPGVASGQQADSSRDLPVLTRSMLRDTTETFEVTGVSGPLIRRSVRMAIHRVLKILQKQSDLHPLLCEIIRLDTALMVQSCLDLWDKDGHRSTPAFTKVQERMVLLSKCLYTYEDIAKKPLSAAQALVIIRDQVHLRLHVTRQPVFPWKQSMKKDTFAEERA